MTKYHHQTEMGPLEKGNNRILWLREQFPWMGGHSGYDQLFRFLENRDQFIPVNVFRHLSRPVPRGLRKIARFISREIGVTPLYSQQSALAELYAVWKGFIRQCSIYHISYLENNLGLLGKLSGVLSLKIIATTHQPLSWWKSKPCRTKTVKNLDTLITLGRKESDYFERLLPGKVIFIPHGVDTEFFHPAHPSDKVRVHNGIRFLFIGRWLRDIKTLADVIRNVCQKEKSVKFDLIVHHQAREEPCFRKLAGLKEISWHSGLTDRELRRLYWRSDGLILPLLDCTANNTILESMSCGLPIVSTRTGDIEDYVDKSFASITPVGDVKGLIEALLHLCHNPEERVKRGKDARLFAEKHFPWEKIAGMTYKLYNQTLMGHSG